MASDSEPGRSNINNSSNKKMVHLYDFPALTSFGRPLLVRRGIWLGPPNFPCPANWLKCDEIGILRRKSLESFLNVT